MIVKLLLRRPLLFVLKFGLLGSFALSQAPPSYDALIEQGKTQLRSGNAGQALATGEQAIRSDATRWEGYALAGGALMNLKRYEEAADDFSHSIDRAPQNKQDGLRELRRQCFAAESGTSTAPASAAREPETTTTQAEVVLWKTIENSTNREDFQNYLSQYPNGAFAVMARSRLENLTKAQEQLAGDWHGTLRAGRVQLRLILHIAAGKDGALKATLDSVDQGAYGIPVGAISLEDAKLGLRVDAVHGTYEGTINKDFTEIDGTWSQGQLLELTFTRTPATR
jgi:tetratricopeptide (TPR) repeat protein